jgi:hypothetical protein
MNAGRATYSRWKRPGKNDMRRRPSRRQIVVSEVVVELVDGIYLLSMDLWRKWGIQSQRQRHTEADDGDEGLIAVLI